VKAPWLWEHVFHRWVRTRWASRPFGQGITAAWERPDGLRWWSVNGPAPGWKSKIKQERRWAARWILGQNERKNSENIYDFWLLI
jgi:hypothetical protein